MDIERLLTIDDFEEAAKGRLSNMAYDYYRSGSGDETTLRRNREAFERFEIVNRVLVDVADPQASTTLLGTEVGSAIQIAPTGFHKLAHPDGELASARAAASLKTLFVASTLATTTLEEIAAAGAGSPQWFQVYMHRDRAFTMRLVERAKAAGYRAIVLTADMPALGRRVADTRNGFRLPDGMRKANLVELEDSAAATEGADQARLVSSRHDASFSLGDLPTFVRACAPLPVVVKGVMRGDDARAASDAGAAAIWVSNHGGRQLDFAPATIDCLEDVVDGVGGRAEVYFDGGVRSGAHALIAMGLGARAVFVGRPMLWGLAAGGEAGVRRAMSLLQADLINSMQLAGCPDASAARRLVRRRR